ncbi:MAG: sugar nucleotide-binding protein [Desulfobacterales bacterium]|nr:sugar nucleotide-binding protein [Desulfobacterales bacterium]
MNILVTGAEGQLGTELVRQAPACGVFVTAPLLAEMDLTNYARVEEVFAAVRPAAVINAAAYTAVDRAETEAELAFAVNAAAPAYIARRCAPRGHPAHPHLDRLRLRRAASATPYLEEDPVTPLGVYGRSKAEGEAAVRARAGTAPHRPHRLALQRPRRQFRQDRDAPGGRARRAAHRGRSARLPHLRRGPGRGAAVASPAA